MPVSVSVQIASLDLLKSCFVGDNITNSFYLNLFYKHVNVNKTLVGRAVEFCNNTNIDNLKYILDDKYATSAKCSINFVLNWVMMAL